MDLTHVVARWGEDLVEFLPRLILVALMLALTIVLSRRAQAWTHQLFTRTTAPRELGVLLGRVARIAILFIGLLMALQKIGLGDTVLSFIAGLGIAGLVIGFALQDIVKQFAAGVLLLILRPFRVGDAVKIAGFEGTVVEVQLRATVLKTVDGAEVLIPNADVYTTSIVNLSRYSVHRRSVGLSLPAASDLPQARAALVRAIGGVGGVLDSPPPAIVGASLEEATTKLDIRFWVDTQVSDADAVTTEVLGVARQVLEELKDQRLETRG